MFVIYVINNEHPVSDVFQHMCSECVFDVLGLSATAAKAEFQLAAEGAGCDFCGRSRP